MYFPPLPIEVVIFLAIAGLVSAFAFYTFKDFDKGIRYIYSNTYHVLDRSLYNGLSFTDMPDPFRDKDGNGNTISPGEGAKRLCEMLVNQINIVTSSCRAENLVSDSGSDFSDDKINFVATNGVRYYITQRMKGEGENAPYFYLIFADINSDKAPNSMAYEPGNEANNFTPRDPDIFAFAALDIGRICPLGPPEVDGRYMLTRVTYNALENIQGEDNEDESVMNVKYSKVSKPYYISKAESWGYYLPNKPVPDSFIIDDTPYSYNGYIRNSIDPNSMIYSFLGGNEIPVVPNTVNLRDASVEDGGYGCVQRSDEECNVIIDRYVH